MFIVIEGIDGAGKSTQARLLAEWFKKKGYDVVLTKEPTDTAFGKLIRRLVLTGGKEGIIDGARISHEAEALLFAADRAEHVHKLIKPSLKTGKIVISDRYFYSSLAYQWARGLDLEWLIDLNRFAVRPDLVILLDLPVKESMKRINGRSIKTEFDKIAELQKKVRENYLKLAERFPEMRIVNALASVEDIHNDIVALVEHELLKR
ncbi:thymidylate kinase [Thermococcus onnurineus NA1]|uniref:Probable thymidylate kinase n=1 Tax=Thermococcus onnurineus (strain NA1) TaxID=523850 RepID=KTHY_THEON|nr:MULTISPECIES: dTMP kinase [Thermococcus]B6YSZ4.1 RecName: Full=Probable thymidylate kinase; AltName: Full=dTMP kinase [Thermococcus onnurineus NA1]ACJ15681.1 thymidylate kinase [Thermococcus onnurineus NA1]NJE46980.1 dTMP kinase [Thermococcus sp. GR7]NJE78968.1 dTMP kinase [Thermococcus sp. GR4]NJF22688.1 dTMP kinase [Thermococcus sp. GR5]